MDHALAIVIPAYKSRFFEAALNSISNQTDQRFRVYVCDDGSPEDLKSICDQYIGKMDIIYHRFPDNIGRRDLVAHWNRSVELANEEWVWLFSDDDRMSPGAVEAFYDALDKTKSEYDLYRFNIEMIDANDQVIGVKEPHPVLESAYDFLKSRMLSRTLSAAVEYIFKKSVFLNRGGFVNFPMAYCSDDASWIAFAGEKPIYTIVGEKIYWRASGINISSGKGHAYPKATALLKFITYVSETFPEKKKELMSLAGNWFFDSLGHIQGRLNFSQAVTLSRNYNVLFHQKGLGAFKQIFALQFRYTRFAGLFKKWSKY